MYAVHLVLSRGCVRELWGAEHPIRWSHCGGDESAYSDAQFTYIEFYCHILHWQVTRMDLIRSIVVLGLDIFMFVVCAFSQIM